MSDSDSESKHSSSTTPDPEAPEDPEGPKKNYSDPKHLFHRPYRKSLLRPSGMVLTKLDLSRHMLLDNAEQEDEQFVKRTVSRQSRLREGASSRTQNLDSASDGCQTEGPELEEHPEEERADGSEQWSDSEDYDTDLDVDATVTEMFQGQTQADQCYSDDDVDDDDEESPDVIRLKDYEKACKTEHAIPQSAILRNLGNRDIDLRHRNVGTKNLKPFFSALKENMRVQRLLLDENGLDEDGMESLANGLRDNVTLSYLSVAGNPLGLKGLVHVVRLLLSNVTIQGLSLSDTKLGGDCIPLLSHLLKANKTLRFLDLSRNTFEEDQMRVMAAAVGENNSLEFLKLSWNNIRQSGAAAIAQSVTVNGKLRVLDLCWNGLGYPGAVAMAASLKVNESLQELDISQNGINWEGAFIISKALVNNSTLKILRMGGNPVTTTGAMDLVEAASSPFCGLRLLDLTNVPVIFETEVLASSISQSRSFRLHHGGVVFIHDKIGRRLDRQRNPMERLLDHLRERMIRPLELLREFDKKNNGRITQAEFMSRLRKANVPLHGFEIRALAASVSDMKLDGTKQINYKKLVDGVEHHIIRDRMRKIRERAKKQRVRTYHTRILSASKPLYSNAQSYTSDTPSSLDMSHPGPPPSAMSLELDRMSRVSRTSKRSRSVVPMLAANDSTHSLVSPLTVKADERKPLLPQLRKTMSTFTLSAPLEEIGLKGKGKKTQKKNSKKQKKRRQSDPVTRETTTLIAQAKET